MYVQRVKLVVVLWWDVCLTQVECVDSKLDFSEQIQLTTEVVGSLSREMADTFQQALPANDFCQFQPPCIYVNFYHWIERTHEWLDPPSLRLRIFPSLFSRIVKTVIADCLFHLWLVEHKPGCSWAWIRTSDLHTLCATTFRVKTPRIGYHRSSRPSLRK